MELAAERGARETAVIHMGAKTTHACQDATEATRESPYTAGSHPNTAKASEAKPLQGH